MDLSSDMKIHKRLHPIWKEYEKIKTSHPNFEHIIGKYQYLCSNKRQTISLIELSGMFYGDFRWEIYQIDGTPELLDDIERYKTKKDAIKRIKELLK